MLEEKFSADKIRTRLIDVYDHDKQFTKLMKGMNDEEVFSLARKLKRGVFFGSPVFDGAAKATSRRC